jgi:transposase
MKVVQEVKRLWKLLTRDAKREVKGNSYHARNAGLQERCKIIVNLVRGNHPAVISEILQCSMSTVYRVAHRFVEQGMAGFADRREENGEEKVSEDYEWRLVMAVAGSPRDFVYRRPTWTQELLILVLEEQTEIRISRTTMSRVLRRLGIRLGSPKPVVRCTWKKARKTRRLNRLKRLIQQLPANEVVVYADEVDVHLNPKIGRDWMLRGTQKRVPTPGQNEKRYLAGALNAVTGKLTWVEYDRKTSDLFIKQLWQLVKHDYPWAKRIHIILDNYKIHKSQRTKLALSALKDKVELHFLPPYCPDDNKIERAWKDLHDNVTRNHKCLTMDELMDEVRAYLHNRNLDLSYSKAGAA